LQPNITLKRDSPFRALLKVYYFFCFGGFVNRPRKARPLALRSVAIGLRDNHGLAVSFLPALRQPDVVGRIYDKLTAHFPHERIFRDLDSIPLGKPFPEVIREAVGKSAAALVIIGPGW